MYETNRLTAGNRNIGRVDTPYPLNEPPTGRATLPGTGRIDLDLYDEHGRNTGITLELVIRIDHVTMWLAERTLAVILRDHLTAWLKQPVHSLCVDDVVLKAEQGVIAITIDMRDTYWVHPEQADDVMAMICGPA